MRKQHVLVVAVLMLGALGPSPLVSGERPARELDARQTVEKFLAAALSGKAKEAAALGEPGKSPSREESIKKNFERLGAYGKKLLVIRLIVDERDALAITENVAVTGTEELPVPGDSPRHKEQPLGEQQGPLSIRLIKVDRRWLIRDIDLGSDKAAKNVKRFLAEHPGSKEVDLKVKIKLLQKERIATLKAAAHDLALLYQRGYASYAESCEVRLLALKAELDAAEEPDRIKLYKAIVDVLKEYETFAEGRVKDGREPRTSVLKVKARRLEAEIDLERAKDREAKESK